MRFALIIYVIGYVHGTTWTDPVDSPAGLIRGQLADDGDYYMYLGIPYATVNEDNPFGVSEQYPKFDGTFDAVDDSAICPQRSGGATVGTLDCLHLNVYVPNTTDTKLPVLVWIHGGQFTTGSGVRSEYGPKFLIRHDIILVSINYRLGIYGFMCLDAPEVPGNQGLKDQYLAIKWVYDNIEAFGGDAEKITIMGQSAGGMSVDYHILSDHPKLYHQAILQSGSALVPEVVFPPDNTTPFTVAERLGLTTNDTIEALSFLAKYSIDSVIASTSGLQFRVCVENKYENVPQIIGIHPERNNASKVNDMTILTGFTSRERYLTIRTPIEQISESFFHDYVAWEYNTEELTDMINKVRRFYIGDNKINEENIWDVIDFASDIKFNHPVQRNVIKYLESGAHVYQYMFSYNGGRNYMTSRQNITEGGAGHMDELGYLFDVQFFTETPTPEDQLVIDRITIMWANFVKYGNPTPSTSDLIAVTWTPASINVVPYLDINSELTTGIRPYHARMSFWDLFYAANKDKLWANIYYDSTSSSTRFSSSVLYISLNIVLLASFAIN